MSRVISNKVCILTGATSGIGYCTALQLAQQGWTVGIICPNEDSGKQTVKIILVTSRAEELGAINFDNLQGEKKYHWAQSYSQSKLANLLFAYELSRRERNNKISVLAVHPGLTHSKLGRNLTGIFRFLPFILRPFMQSPEKAASFLTTLLKLPPCEEARYFIKNKLAKSSPRSYDIELSSKLWAISETLIQGKK